MNKNLIWFYAHKGSKISNETIVAKVSYLEKYSNRLDVACAAFEHLIKDMSNAGVDFNNFTISAKVLPYEEKLK